MVTINKVRVAQDDGSFGPEIEIGAKAENVMLQSGESVEEYLQTHSGGGGGSLTMASLMITYGEDFTDSTLLEEHTFGQYSLTETGIQKFNNAIAALNTTDNPFLLLNVTGLNAVEFPNSGVSESSWNCLMVMDYNEEGVITIDGTIGNYIVSLMTDGQGTYNFSVRAVLPAAERTANQEEASNKSMQNPGIIYYWTDGEE